MFQNLDFADRFAVGAFLRPLGKVYYVYLLMHDNQPFYVGTSCNWKRVYDHFSENNRVNFLLKRKLQSVQTCGGDITIRLHQQFQTADEMYAEEVRLISLYGKKIDNQGGVLTNLSDGGEGRAGIGTSDKQKEAARRANTGRPKSEETRKRLSISLTKTFSTRDGTFKGRKHSEATKLLMSQNNSGVNHPQYGIRGEEHWNYGKVKTPETILKIKEGQSKIDMSCTEKRKQQLRDFWLSQPILICPHCSKESYFKPAMIRFHFDNCKSKT